MSLIIGISILFYTYIGYGMIMWIVGAFKKEMSQPIGILPEVTVLIAAYNEEDYIYDKIKNTLQLNYPPDKLKIWVVADGSDDHTVPLAQEFRDVQVFHQKARNGKVHAVNRVMGFVESPITVMTDANAMLNQEALLELVNHFTDSNVAAVSGEKKVLVDSEEDAVSAGEGIYWKYESFLKKMDSKVNTMVGAAGELLAVRTNLYEAVPNDIIIEDFHMTMKLCSKGYKVAYAPNAIASEKSSADIGEELKRKVRICAGGFQSILQLGDLLNPFKHGFLTFQYISHRVLRWTLAPLALIIVFANSLININASIWYELLFYSQVLFYVTALAGYFLQKRKLKLKGVFIPYYFTIMNLAAFMGLSKLIFSNNLSVWEKSNRKL